MPVGRCCAACCGINAITQGWPTPRSMKPIRRKPARPVAASAAQGVEQGLRSGDGPAVTVERNTTATRTQPRTLLVLGARHRVRLCMEALPFRAGRHHGFFRPRHAPLKQYSPGDRPTRSRDVAAKAERDIPAHFAKLSTFQGCCTFTCIACTAASILSL
jgi:hypothetical protein